MAYQAISRATLHVPAGTKSRYQNLEGWNVFKNIVDPADNWLKVGDTFVVDDVPYVVMDCGDWPEVFAGDMNYQSSATSVVIPSTVVGPDGVTYHVSSFSTDAFKGFANLMSVTIPKSIETIYGTPFTDCQNLVSIVVEDGNPVYDSREGCNAIIETATNILRYGCKNSTIPQSVTTIGWDAFAMCTGLTSFTIPDYVTKIEDHAFYGCSGLTTLTLPNAQATYGYDVFEGCTALTSVTIPSLVTSINEGLFSNCYGIKEVYVLAEPPPMGGYTFNWICEQATLYVPAGTKAKYQATDDWKNFKSIVEIGEEPGPDDPNEKIEAMKKDLEMETMKCMEILNALSYELQKKDPEGVARELRQDLEYCAMYIKEAEYRVSICKTEDDIKDAQSQIEKMRAQLDYLNYQIEKLELEEPLTVTTVEGVKLTLKIISETEKTAQVGDGEKAALSQSTTGSVTIPASAGDYQIVAIAKWAFDGCYGLEAIHIPASVTSLSNNFLGNCRNLTSLTVAADNPVYNSPANSNAIVKTADQMLVAACNSTVLPEGIVTIGEYAFAYCDAMDYLNLQGVSTFHDYAFAYSNVRIIATGDINQIGFSLGAFNCSKVEMFYIRQTDGTVSMFCNGTMWRNAYAPGWAAPTFTTYTVPDEVHLGNQSFIVSKLGHSAFSNCTQLTEVTIPATITAIEGKYAFNKCTALHTITSLIKNPFAIDSELFVAEVYADATLYVPAGTKAKYQATEGWKEFKNIVEMAPEKGDIGGKGYTDVTDVVAAINHILGEQPLEEADAAVVDMNSDGEVNVADIILLVKQILEQGNHSETAQAARGDRKTVDLSRFTAMQLSVDVPMGSRLSGIRLAGRNSDTHQLMYQQAADGSYTVVVWSIDNQTFSPVDGRLIEVTVEGGGEAAARSVLLADKNGERLTLGSLPVGTATEITTVCTDGAATADIYDLRGNKVLTKGALMERLPKGVYIMDGKTIIK